MINFQLRDFVEKTIPDFNPNNPLDVIKAEKILKAEAKLNSGFRLNEIDDYIAFLKNSEENFDKILALPVIADINSGNYPTKIEKPYLKDISWDEVSRFSEKFSGRLQEFLGFAIRNHKWDDLVRFYKNYTEFFDLSALEFLKEQLHEKNNLVIDALHRSENFVEMKKNYPFVVEKGFYFIQSQIDPFEFDEEILDINNIIAYSQLTYASNKVVLGEILSALSYFRSEDDTTKKVLKDNREIGEGWQEQKKGDLYARLSYAISGFFSQNKNSGLVIAVSVLSILLFLASYVYAATLGWQALLGYFVVNAAVFFIYRNQAKFYFNYQTSKTKEELLRKVAGSLVVLMIFGIPLMIVFAIAISDLASSIEKGKFPLNFAILIGFVLYKFLRK